MKLPAIFREGRAGAVAAFAALVPLALAAQNSPQRAAVFRWRDSLAGANDTSGLRALEVHAIDSARVHRNDAMLHMRLGYLGLRLAELTGESSHYRDAEGEFQWATELQPQWPLGWYALGRAELAEADMFPPLFRGMFSALGRDVFSQPAKDIARSAEVDSSFVDGVLQLSDSALARGIHSHLTTALEALRQLAGAPASRDPALLLARGRVEREVGNTDSALVALRELLRRDRDNAVGLLELGRTELAAGNIAGTAPWYRGLARADSASLPLYRFDLSLVMSDSALRVFDAARGTDRVTVARRFWDTRDPDAINSSAERLREHYRRIEYAHRSYPLVPAGRRYDSLRRFAPTGSLFDDRGRIYVRHGEPDARTTLAMAGIPPNETWVYHRPGSDLLFNFAQPDSAQGYRMYESLLDIVGLGKAAQTTGQGDVAARLANGTVMATYGAAWTAQAAQEMLYSRQRISPLYGQMLSAGPRGAASLQAAERAAGKKSIAIGLQTDSWKFGYELPLTADIDVVAVGSDAHGTQLQVAFAIPGSLLYAPPSTGAVVYPVRTRVSVRNAAGEIVASADTLRQFVSPGPVSQGDHLLGRLPLSVPPGDYSVRVALETPSRGLITKPRTVHVAALSRGSIELSDLALGSRSVRLPWPTSAADTAWINPLHRFSQGEPIHLYFEVGGLAPGTSYNIQYAVVRSGRTRMQFGFTTVAAGTPDQVHRDIDVGRLGPGGYLIRVTVTGPGGMHRTRESAFTITK